MYDNIKPSVFLTAKPKERFEGYEKGLDMWTHVTNWSRSIEVNYFTKEGKEILTRVYFPYDPAVSFNDKMQSLILNISYHDSQELLHDWYCFNIISYKPTNLPGVQKLPYTTSESLNFKTFLWKL